MSTVLRRGLALVLFMFVVELLMMAGLSRSAHLPPFLGALLDALVVSLSTLLFLWWVVVSPLRQAAEESQLILRTATDGYFVIDVEGRFRDVNDAYCALSGYSRDQLLAMRIVDVEASESAAETAAHIAEVRLRGSDRFATRQRRKDGVVLDVEVSTIYLPLKRGRFVAFVRDVTERQRHAAELRRFADDLEQRVSDRTAELEAAHRTLVESHDLLDLTGRMAKVGGWALDVDTQRLTWSDEVYRIHEVDVAIVPTVEDAIRFYAPEMRHVIALAVQNGITSGAPWDLTLPLITATGRRIWVRAQGAAEYRDGRVVRLHGAFQDITARREADQLVRLQSAALNAAANAMIITDRDGTILWANPAFTEISGFTLEEAVGRNPRDLVKSGAHDLPFYANMWNTIVAGGVWKGEVTNRRKDGTLHPEFLTITPVRDERGEVTNFIAVRRDLTEEHALQSRLRQIDRVESLGVLAGGVAHDFNNLLTVINGTAELALLSLPEGRALRAELQTIRLAGAKAAVLTRQLLAFGRKQELKPEVLDLNAVVTDLEAMLPGLLREDIRLRFDLAPEPVTVKVDRSQVDQVILNLAVNARDAMPHGGRLTIETRTIDMDEEHAARLVSMVPGGYALLSVSDTGIGMDERTRTRIFEPFYTTKPSGKGTGLGLSTVYGIVKQSGGNVWVYSGPGQGARFEVYFPLVKEALTEAHAPGSSAGQRGTETILVVDDEAALCALAARVLTRSGYVVLTATSGKEALALLERSPSPVHLLLTDVVMPDMSGSELVTEIRRRHPQMRALYASGYAADHVARLGVRDVYTDFIGKPYVISALTRKVREVLDA